MANYLCNKRGECGVDDCPHAVPHDCENKGYAMECIRAHQAVRCLDSEERETNEVPE